VTAVVRWAMSQRCPKPRMDGCLHVLRSQGVRAVRALLADHSTATRRHAGSAPPARISAQCSRTGKRASGQRPEALNSLRGLRYPRMVTMPA
jgi:hypothetical protein